MPFSNRVAAICLVLVTVAVCAVASAAQGVKRTVVIKIDGLPAYYVDRFVKERDPKTGRSMLPWIEEAFYKNGSRVPNFYTRGMSLSGPSWGQLDTGQHLQIKGNVEYDRYTLHAYDYLNFIPYYLNYGLSNRKADMPAAEVMDQLGIPLLIDVFDYDQRYTSHQLYQRGNNWEVIGSGFVNLYPGNLADMIDEWTIGLNFRKLTIDQSERDIIGKLDKNPEIDYFDYYDVSFDHISHHNNDTRSRLSALKGLDRLIGRIWTAIRSSRRAGETALVLVSDHGFNSDDRVYSQGFNLVKLLTSPAGGGHHVVTKRRLMLDYSIKGIYPFVPLIKTESKNSTYLQGRNSDYPTALLDFDGNERSSIHLRNSDLNMLHIMLQQLQREDLSPELRSAASAAFFEIIDTHRGEWRRTLSEIGEELDALKRWIGPQEKIVAARPNKYSSEDIRKGIDKEGRRAAALLDIAVREESDYRSYAATLSALSNLSRESFDPRRIKIEQTIAPGSMGEANSIHQLQNYVVGPARGGFVLDANGDLDLKRSFTRVDYFELLLSQRVRNNVQPLIGNRPVDFVAVRLPADAVDRSLTNAAETADDPIWLYGGDDKQALILSKTAQDGTRSYRYVPVASLEQGPRGKVTFQIKPIGEGFPLRYFEDRELAVRDRASWFDDFHTETEWLAAVHRTRYSNALIGLNEQLDRHPVFADAGGTQSPDDVLLRRFRQRQRQLTEADLLILANDHWNFDVRGFNPGGNHGSFFRVSTNSTFMIAGGTSTGIPRGLAVDRPYDSMSFVPTLLRLMGKIDGANEPSAELKKLGFRRFPGKVVEEITGKTDQPASR
ncbi:MAG: alkaline phosphatase family protein [Pyrinomonadaceae bacterium]